MFLNLEFTETVLQATVASSDSGEKKPLLASIKASIVALVSYVVALILKPFQMLKSIFTVKTVVVNKEVKSVAVAATPTAIKVTVPVRKPVASAADIAARKYALEKLKEIDQGTSDPSQF